MATIEQRKNNIKGLWADPRKRTMIIIMVGLVAAMLIVGLFSGGGDDQNDANTGTRTVNAPNIEARPGLVPDQEYTQAVREENEERLREAQETGSTVLPTLESGSVPPPLDPLANAQAPEELPPAPQAPVPAPVVSPVVPAPQPVAEQPAPAPTVTAEDVTRSERYKSVQNQLTGYMQAWTPVVGMQEFDYNGVAPEPAAAPMAGGSQNLTANASQSNGGGSTAGGASFVRAGTIIPAVLMTSVNSDVPGPVVAQIVSGPLNGARVLGRFQATEKHVVIQFDTISMPGQNKSFNVSAYAVNDNLGVGLATDVDNHYLRRYGLLLAAGFLEGYSNAVARAGTTTNVTDGGSVIITQDELDTDEIRKVALGNAGSAVAAEMAQRTRVPPTVKVEGKDGGGVPIGLLFMNDF